MPNIGEASRQRDAATGNMPLSDDARIFFIGGGALLSKAVAHTLDAGLGIALVCCPVDDAAIPKLRRMKVAFMTSNDPNADFAAILAGKRAAIVFSINNKYVLGDGLLSEGPSFFNIHSGLVQKYRGIAEVCVFAALCQGETKYGVTLHRILPNQGVDCGPVVDQRVFSVNPGNARFFDVMNGCLQACDEVFRTNLSTIANGTHEERHVPPADATYLYRDVVRICANTPRDALKRACDLGSYEKYFPRLSAKIDGCLG